MKHWQATASKHSFASSVVASIRIVSKMIFNKEMSAAWDGDTLIITKTEQSSLQQLSVRVSEKVGQLAESNERLLDPLNGFQMFGNREDWQDQRGGGRKGQWQDQRSGGSRFARSGASGRGEYRGNRSSGGPRQGHRRDGGGRGHQNRDGGSGGGGGGGGYNNRDREEREKPKMAWNAVGSEAK